MFQRIVQSGNFTNGICDVLAETIICISVENKAQVSASIIRRIINVGFFSKIKNFREFIQCLEKTCHSGARGTLVDHPLWLTVCVLMRIVQVLSFNSVMNGLCIFANLFLTLIFPVIPHLPYILHLCVLLVHIGTIQQRNTIHSIVINVVNSLLTNTQAQLSGKPGFVQKQFVQINLFQTKQNESCVWL